MFSKILIANRGEIAVRIIRACKEMGISTVAVYSGADAEAIHVSMADHGICIGGDMPSESYLNQKNIISAALAMGAQAIHPGYGFLAENAEFAALCRANNIVFIGPMSKVISSLGDKERARQLMIKAGVPVIPGSGIVSTAEEALLEAEKIGYPLMVKARAGGGGRGIRLVSDPSQMRKAFASATEEARSAFGDSGVYLEKHLTGVKHVEIQLLADEKGNVVSLGERECSIQRGNQKLLEEAPSPAVTPELRAAMISDAVKAAKAAEYTSVGTVEFLLEGDQNFYFMEMNTRLQVEHPVTEKVTGIDVVKWQIRIADGVLLDFTQNDIKIEGASIECRINAGGCGEVKFLHLPGGPGVRFDTALYQGYEVPPFYDSLLGKLIVHAKTREEAMRKMRAALSELVIDGIPNNIEEQIATVGDPVFRSGDYYTNFKPSFF